MWDTKFWLKHSDWPIDGPTDVFLGRAFDRVGKAMFGSEWLGTEVLTEVNEPLPNLITRDSPNYRRLETIAQGVLKKFDAPLTSEDWDEARRRHKEIHSKREVAIRRRTAVREAIIGGCHQGVLNAHYRPRRGGHSTPFPASWWNTEVNAQRFVYCQINPRDPYANGLAGDDYCWVFLSRETLDQFLVQRPHSDVAKKFDLHLSPYLRVMLSVAEKLQVTPENQPKKASIVAELEAAWTLSDPLSTNMVEAMATALREPGSQLGRAAKPETKKN